MGQALLHIKKVFDQIEKNSKSKKPFNLENDKNNFKKREPISKTNSIKQNLKINE